MTLKELDTTNPDFRLDRIKTVDAFADSGADLLEIARAQTESDNCGLEVPVLFKRKGETREEYLRRVDRATSLGYMGSVIAAYTSTVVSDTPLVNTSTAVDFIKDFQQDCDLTGRDLPVFLTSMIDSALRHGRSFALVEFPQTVVEPASALEADQLGVSRAYLVEVPRANLIDWEYNRFGRMVYAKIHDCRHLRGGITEETWVEVFPERTVLHTLTYERGKRPADVEVPNVVVTRAKGQPFPVVPLDLSTLQLGSKLYPLERAIVNEFSMRVFYDSLMGFPEKVYKRKNAEAPQRDGVTTIIERDDDVTWLETTGTPSESLGLSAADLRQELYRIANDLPAASTYTPSAFKQSGESKDKDLLRAHRVCRQVGKEAREFVEGVLYVIRAGRGETAEDEVRGMDNFSKENIVLLLEVLRGIGSPTADLEARKRAVRVAMPDLDEQTTKTIDQELSQGTPAPGSQDDIQADDAAASNPA